MYELQIRCDYCGITHVIRYTYDDLDQVVFEVSAGCAIVGASDKWIDQDEWEDEESELN